MSFFEEVPLETRGGCPGLNNSQHLVVDREPFERGGMGYLCKDRVCKHTHHINHVNACITSNIAESVSQPKRGIGKKFNNSITVGYSK
ncbi:MAG: hypothetical protein JSV57_03770 [Candidatus Bathyarchaeota archaeon]|nr:MAG: hypothetical protein JSV57_03770 [Candidatus Bathyarchaeota archaeon]